MKLALFRLALCLAIGAAAGWALSRAYLAQGDVRSARFSEVLSAR